MVSGLPAIIPQAGSPQFVYATSINGQPVPVSINQPEREQQQRRDSKISLPPIFNFSQPFTTPASPTTSETTSSLSWNSEQEKHEMITSTGITNNENSWKMQDEMPNLHLSQCFETKKQKNHCLEPLKLKDVPKQKIVYEHEKIEEKLPLRTPSPIDKRPIRPSPGGRYQIPDLPGEDLYHAVPIKEKETPKKEKNNNINNNYNFTDDSAKKRSPSDLGLFSSVEIRSSLRRGSNMLPPRPPTRNASMTKLASQLSPKAATPPADLRRTTKPPLPSSDSSNSINTDSQESPRTFFTRNKQYRSFNVKTTNVGVNPAVEHLKMLKQKLLDHQQVIKNRGVFQPREV
uniref:WH2 domain-containing protein n=1 Tax=Panagrolaimus sp. PS1159 TaxID=55785 RepID=A0AC35GV03_9BILA